MKIIHVVNYYHENFGYQENWLPYYQMKQGHDVQIYSSNKFFPFPFYDQTMKQRLGKREHQSGIYYDKEIKITKFKSLFELPNNALIVFSFLGHLFNEKPDVIHLHGATNPNLIWIFFFSLWNNVKIFIDSHVDFKVVRHETLKNRIYYKFWKYIYSLKIVSKRINHFLPITLEAKEFLMKYLSIPEEKMTINYLGVDLDEFYFSDQEAAELRNQLNIPKDAIILVNAGKQYPEKRIEFILELLAKLIQKNNVYLMLIGNANEAYCEFLKKFEEPVGNYLIKIPFQKNQDLRKYYSLADIGIWPGIPSNTIQEAMACKTMIIVPNDKITNHLISFDNGISLTFNIELDYQNLENIIHDMQILNRMKENSLVLANTFSWRCIAIDCLHLYHTY